MKKKIIVILLLSVFLFGCSKTKVIHGVEYDTYGLFNSEEKKNPNIVYEIVWGNVFWGIVGFESIIAPIYFFGFDVCQPVRWRQPNEVKGQAIRK